jgi:hypothetical protein
MLNILFGSIALFKIKLDIMVYCDTCKKVDKISDAIPCGTPKQDLL